MKVYITAYALSRGIIVAEDNEKNRLEVKGERLYISGQSYGSSFSKKEWYDNLEDAVKDAETRRDKKLLSLKKQMKKLEEVNFAEMLKNK